MRLRTAPYQLLLVGVLLSASCKKKNNEDVVVPDKTTTGTHCQLKSIKLLHDGVYYDWGNYTYTASGKVSSRKAGNVSIPSYTIQYDSLERPISFTPLEGICPSCFPKGRPHTFFYDSLNRISSAILQVNLGPSSNGPIYRYDTLYYTHTPSNQLKSVRSYLKEPIIGYRQYEYIYDEIGNLTFWNQTTYARIEPEAGDTTYSTTQFEYYPEPNPFKAEQAVTKYIFPYYDWNSSSVIGYSSEWALKSILTNYGEKMDTLYAFRYKKDHTGKFTEMTIRYVPKNTIETYSLSYSCTE